MNIDLMTWATMIEVPLFAALFRLIGKTVANWTSLWRRMDG